MKNNKETVSGGSVTRLPIGTVFQRIPQARQLRKTKEPNPQRPPRRSCREHIGECAEVGKTDKRPSHTALYLLSRLQEHDESWYGVTPGALVKLGKSYGLSCVQTALGFIREELPTQIRAPYAYLEAVCRDLGRGGAWASGSGQ